MLVDWVLGVVWEWLDVGESPIHQSNGSSPQDQSHLWTHRSLLGLVVWAEPPGTTSQLSPHFLRHDCSSTRSSTSPSSSRSTPATIRDRVRVDFVLIDGLG